MAEASPGHVRIMQESRIWSEVVDHAEEKLVYDPPEILAVLSKVKPDRLVIVDENPRVTLRAGLDEFDGYAEPRDATKAAWIDGGILFVRGG